MRDTIEDICYKYNKKYGEVYDKYNYLETKILIRENGTIKGLFFTNPLKYQTQIEQILQRYYQTQKYKENKQKKEK